MKNMNNLHSTTTSMTSMFGATVMNHLKGLAFAVAAVASVATAGCGEAIEINRVGPNVVEKGLFTGEWHFKTTVVDKQFHNDQVFIGLEGGLERVRWEITETQLVAHRSYERIPGSDPSNPGDQNVLAAFPITKHFDIRRGYNPVNGVENNVLEENDYDRVWWEREFMRVDWSKNVAATYDLSGTPPSPCYEDSDCGVGGSCSARDGDVGECQGGGSVFVNHNAGNDPTYPWRVRVGEDYIETTIDALVKPDPYVCYYLDSLSPCNAANVKMKMSFRKLDPANDYVALDYPDFTSPRLGELARADNGEPIFSSVPTTDNELVPRICTTDETGPTNKATFNVVEQGGTTRMCNSDPFRGDAANGITCTAIEATCANAEELWFRAGPEDVGITCDPSEHDPDDCFKFTLPVFSRFGFFRTDRFVEDRENGWTLTGRERLINRWNIWEKSHDDDGNVLPFAARTPKPIIYYLNPGFPVTLIDSVKELEADWDTTFRSAVASAQGKKISDITTQMVELRINDCNIENVNTFAADNDLRDALNENGIDEVAYGNLENACAVLEFETLKRRANDETAAVFTWQQLGDLRYSFLNWTTKPELAGPLGYGPSAADPVTGEIISANANLYGASLDVYANWGADIVQLLNGELTTDDIINGTHVREHVEAVRNRWNEKIPKDQVAGFIKLFDNRTRFMSDSQYYKQVPLTSINSNLDILKESGIEEQYLVTGETLRMFGQDPQAQREGRMSDRLLETARPSTWLRTQIPEEARMMSDPLADGDDATTIFGNPTTLGVAGKTDELADYLGRKNFCFLAQQVEPAVADLATRLKDAGLSREEMVQSIRAKIFVAVTAHELGHTFGLRHNFEGSADALNFFPEFWDVSGDDLDDEHKHLSAKSDKNADGLPSKSELAYSSIMDYHQHFNSDFAGIGLYDKAAIKMGYAEMVEIFDEGEVNGQFVARDWLGSMFILDPYSLPYLVGGTTDSVTGGSTADEKINGEYTNVLNDYEAGDEYALLDIQNNAGIAPNAANLYRRRDIPFRDFMRNEVLRLAYVGGYDNVSGLQNAGLLDDDGRAPKYAVPYSFCPDIYAWGGSLTCNRYDMGITSEEIVTNAGQMYEFYHPFDAFRRERVLNPFYSWPASYMNRLYSRTYQPMLNAFRYFYYYRRGSIRVFPAVQDWSTAALIGMNFFTRVLQTPDVGTYCKDSTETYLPQGSAQLGGNCDAPLELNIGQGREFNSSWDNEYDFRPVNIGNYWDKVLAIQSLTDSDAFFFRDFSSFTNRGAFSIGYYRVFQPEMLKLFGGLIRGDASSFTPRVVEQDGELKINYQPFITTDIYGEPIEPDPALQAGNAIIPAQSFQMRYYATVLGMVNLSSTLDQTMDFASRARVVIAGSSSDPTYNNPDLDILDFTDPTSGVIYRSAAVDGTENSIGYKVLEDAKVLAEGDWAAARTALDAAEAGVDTAAIDNARREFLIQDAKLQEKTQIIDFMVLIGNIFEYPG